MATIAVGTPIESPQIRQESQVPKAIHPAWTASERVLFRVSLLFILQLILPFRAQFWQRLIHVRSLRDFYGTASIGGGLTYINPSGESGRWGIGSFANWGIALLVAVALGLVWTWLARNSKRKEYTVAYYWLRLLTRYWVALNILHYAYLKVYPMQMPFPSISNLHTLVGETAPYRYYWAIIGLSTWYQVVLGCMEAIAGSLLFFRRTTAIGALLNLGILYNVAHANFAYDGGVHLLSAEISLLSGFLLIQYIPDLYRLLIQKEDVIPSYYRPQFTIPWQRYGFTGAKYLAWFVFIPLYLFTSIHGYLYSNFSKEPRGPGLEGAKGYYAISEFKLNGKELPYSPIDPVRWQDAIFEDYPTLSFKVDKALPIRLENGGPGFKDAEKRYELAGYAGGRTYLHYDIDEVKHTLTLQDKNAEVTSRDPSKTGPAARLSNGTPVRGSASSGRGRSRGKKQEAQKLVWHYERPSSSRIILTGETPDKQQFYAVLDRIDERLPINIDSPIQGEPLKYDRQFGRRYPLYSQSFDGTADTPNRDRER